jgi:Holliday junction resolvase RusA-like endonuclease
MRSASVQRCTLGAVKADGEGLVGGAQRIFDTPGESMIEFTAHGTPVPQGSIRSFTRNGKTHYLHGNSDALLPYRQVLKNYAISALVQDPTICDDNKGKSAYKVEMYFRFRRPVSVKRKVMNTRPDLDKLQRAVLDALTGVMFPDDGRVTDIVTNKDYDDTEYTIVRVYKKVDGEWQ